MSEGFMTSADTAMLFFRFCHRYGIKDREGRTAVLRELVKRKQAKYLRDPHKFLEGKRVLKIQQKRGNA